MRAREAREAPGRGLGEPAQPDQVRQDLRLRRATGASLLDARGSRPGAAGRVAASRAADSLPADRRRPWRAGEATEPPEETPPPLLGLEQTCRPQPRVRP